MALSPQVAIESSYGVDNGLSSIPEIEVGEMCGQGAYECVCRVDGMNVDRRDDAVAMPMYERDDAIYHVADSVGQVLVDA